MKCYHCSQEISNGAEKCPYCGAFQGAGATVVLDQVFNPYSPEAQSGKTDDLTTVLNQMASAPAAQGRPAVQFPTNRSLWKMILFGLLTFGIYNIVVYCKMITELNVAASRYDGKRTMPFFALVTLAPFTFGIAIFVWYHKLSERIGAEVDRRGYDYKFSASTFWLWNVLGSLILVGPFVYLHKLVTAMNMINEDFNENG